MCTIILQHAHLLYPMTNLINVAFQCGHQNIAYFWLLGDVIAEYWVARMSWLVGLIRTPLNCTFRLVQCSHHPCNSMTASLPIGQTTVGDLISLQIWWESTWESHICVSTSRFTYFKLVCFHYTNTERILHLTHFLIQTSRTNSLLWHLWISLPMDIQFPLWSTTMRTSMATSQTMSKSSQEPHRAVVLLLYSPLLFSCQTCR